MELQSRGSSCIAAMYRDVAQISLLTWNINGLKSKVDYIRDLQKIIKGKVDIVFLQETHIGPKDTWLLDKLVEWYAFFTVHDPKSKGVGILIKNYIDCEFIEDDIHTFGSYIIVKCKIRGQLYTLVNVYNHPSERDIVDTLLPYLHECAEGVLVIGGDFNTTLNPYLDRTPTETQDNHAALRECVEKFTASLNLVDVWRRINPTERKFTFSQNNSESRLDYIFMQEESMWRVKTCQISNTLKKHSDHKPVWLQFTSTPSSHGPLPEADMIKKTDFLNQILDVSYGNDRIKSVDIAMAAQSLPNPKRPGPDGIPVCFYKSHYPRMVNSFKILFNKILDNTIDDVVQMSFNYPIPSSDDTSYHFFNVDYLVLATILARLLEKRFKIITAETQKTKKKIKGLIVIHPGRIEKVKWSLLEEAIKALEDPILNSTIVDKLLRRSDQDQDQEYIQLRRGCPLTPALLKLYVTYLILKVQTDKLFPTGMTVGILIYGETVIMSLSFKANEKTKVRRPFLEETRRARQDLISAIFDQLPRRSMQDEDKHEDEEEEDHKGEHQDKDQEYVQLCCDHPRNPGLLTLCVAHLMSKVQTRGRFFPTSMIIRNLPDSETVMISVSFK